MYGHFYWGDPNSDTSEAIQMRLEDDFSYKLWSPWLDSTSKYRSCLLDLWQKLVWLTNVREVYKPTWIWRGGHVVYVGWFQRCVFHQDFKRVWTGLPDPARFTVVSQREKSKLSPVTRLALEPAKKPRGWNEKHTIPFGSSSGYFNGPKLPRFWSFQTRQTPHCIGAELKLSCGWKLEIDGGECRISNLWFPGICLLWGLRITKKITGCVHVPFCSFRMGCIWASNSFREPDHFLHLGPTGNRRWGLHFTATHSGLFLTFMTFADFVRTFTPLGHLGTSFVTSAARSGAHEQPVSTNLGACHVPTSAFKIHRSSAVHFELFWTWRQPPILGSLSKWCFLMRHFPRAIIRRFRVCLATIPDLETDAWQGRLQPSVPLINSSREWNMAVENTTMMFPCPLGVPKAFLGKVGCLVVSPPCRNMILISDQHVEGDWLNK